MKLKDTYSLEEKLMTNLDSILKNIFHYERLYIVTLLI